MTDDINAMLKELRSAVKGLAQSKKVMNNILDQQVAQLPEDKRMEAMSLINKARTGKHIPLDEMMSFVRDVGDKEKSDIKKGVDRVNKKGDEVSK